MRNRNVGILILINGLFLLYNGCHAFDPNDGPPPLVFQLGAPNLEEILSKEIPGWDQINLSSLVIFGDKNESIYSKYVAGNGVLINQNTILTAKHVAERIEEHRDRYDLLMINETPKSLYNLFTPLKYKETEYFSENENLDLAFVKVETINKSRFPEISLAEIYEEQMIYVVGAHELNPLPTIGLGVVTTNIKTFKLGSLKDIAFGSSIHSWPGQSGAPVYSCDSGNLIGIYVGGPKESVKTGEALVPAEKDKAKWRAYKNWSRVAPVSLISSKLGK